MANQTITKTPESSKQKYTFGEWPTSWSAVPSYDVVFGSYAYRVETPGNVQINKLSLYASFTPADSSVTKYSVYCSIYADDPTMYQLTPLATADFVQSSGAAASHTFPFDQLNIKTDYVYFVVEGVAEIGEAFLGDGLRIGSPSVSVTFEAPALQVTVSTASLYVGYTVSVGFNDTRMGQTIKLRPYYGSSTPLGSEISVTSDTYELKGVESWFNDASVSGDTMRVTLHASDAWGRTNSSASFELKRRKALTPTITNPTGTKNAGSAIKFSWTSSGDGTQTKAELQWSADRITWTELKTLTGSAQSWEAPAATFKYPGGLIYWRIKLTNSYKLESDWVQGSFTAQYTPATVTIEKPVSGSYNGAEEINFSWTITEGSGTIETTQMAYSTDDGLTWTTLINQTGKVESYKASAGQFSAGKITWRVRAKDSYSGWSAWKQASFTVSYTGASVSLTTPTSGSKDGGQKIQFAWTITAGGGTLTGTQMEYSVDDGINWVQVFNASGERTSYEAASGLFPAGKITWHVRVKDSYSGWSEWRSASFTVSYSAPTINLTTPTSGSKDGSQKIQFSWTITPGSGSVKATQMEYSTDDGLNWQTLVNTSGKATSYTANAAKFPTGKITWRVRAEDSYSGWSDWKTASFSVQYTAVSKISPANSPTSGRISASTAQTYAVELTASAPVYTPFTIQSATMYWRAGTSGDYTAVPMTASEGDASVVIAGGTFPSGTIQWYAEATDNTGATRATEVYTLLALNAAVEVVPLSPINTIEGTSNEITFTWLYYSLDGTAQSRAVLEYSRDGESWNTIANVHGSGTTYTAPAGFFTSAGLVYWRVQAFNASGTAGPKSAAVSFTLFGSSSVTSVIGDGKPFATVKWQAEGQVSYELMIGDKQIGPYFGADVRSYTVTEPLVNGRYTIRIRIQNKYGIWSEWAEANMRVRNQPGLGITIQDAQSGVIDAPNTYRASISILAWGPGEYFMIYRDGEYIGKTTSRYFEDRTTIGAHRYQVFQALGNGYVDRSNIITIDVKTKCPVIAPLAGGEFIELRLSTDADRAQDIQRSREVVHVHYSGARYPSSEIGEAETLSVSFDAAWKQTDKAAADAFEALVGEDVIFKTPGGYVIVGTLEGYELYDPSFYKSYRCTLQQGDWRDFVNVT